jgi:hypothetical protein
VAPESVDPRPAWALDPFERFLTYLETEERLLGLAIKGIRMITTQAQALEVLYEPLLTGSGFTTVTDVTPEEAESHIAQAKRSADLARSEVETEFPLLHAHSLLGIWGALEAVVEDVVRAWLTHRKKLLVESEPLSGVKVPLAAFQAMRPSQRIDYLIDQFPRGTGVGGGFPRFEKLLSIAGLDGQVDEILRRKLIEVHQTRNVYAHRSGFVDSKARQACPWRRDWKVGKPVLVGHKRYRDYSEAIVEYVFELIVRSSAKFDFDARAHALRAEKSSTLLGGEAAALPSPD